MRKANRINDVYKSMLVITVQFSHSLENKFVGLLDFKGTGQKYLLLGL